MQVTRRVWPSFREEKDSVHIHTSDTDSGRLLHKYHLKKKHSISNPRNCHNLNVLPPAVFPNFFDAAFSRSFMLRISSWLSGTGIGTGAPTAILDSTDG